MKSNKPNPKQLKPSRVKPNQASRAEPTRADRANQIIAWLLEANKVWRAYRVVPTAFTAFCLYMVYTTMAEANMMNASWDLGAVLGGMGLLIERVLSAYTKTGEKLDHGKE